MPCIGQSPFYHCFVGVFFWAFAQKLFLLCCSTSLCTFLFRYRNTTYHHEIIQCSNSSSFFTARVLNILIMLICFWIPPMQNSSQKIFPSFCFPYPEMFFIITVLKRMKYFFSSRAKLKPAEIWMLFFSVSHNQHHFTKWMDKVSYKLAEVFMATYHWLEKY